MHKRIGRVLRPAAALVAVLAASGCGAGTKLLHSKSSSTSTSARLTSTAPPPPSASAYLAQLRAEVDKFAAAERRIPKRATTPRALSRSVSLLASAISRLADGLAAIRSPASVAPDHARLGAILRAYAARLRLAVRSAVQPGGELRAGQRLIAATNTATARFSATISKIYSTLGAPQT